MKNHERLRLLTGYASVIVAFVLILAKIAAYFSTGSVALLSSLVDSCLDLIASLITAFGLSKAMQPPDREHRFGHGKAEPLAALAQAAFIIGSSALLSLEALGHILDPRPLNNSFVGYTVMLFAIFMTLCLLALQNYTVRKTNSLAIKADRLHYAGDALINLAVIVALAGHEFLKLPWLDPFFALLIAGSMIWGAVRIGKHSMDVLMDSELPEEDRRKIFSLALSVAGVKGAHDLRTRSDGVRPVIEMHVEMPPSIRLREAHEICENIERKLHKTYPEASILLHQDPVGVREERLDEQIEKEPSSST